MFVTFCVVIRKKEKDVPCMGVFFMCFWVVLLYSVFVPKKPKIPKNLKNLKLLKRISLVVFQPCDDPVMFREAIQWRSQGEQ